MLEFYMQILWNFPQVVTNNFKPAYNSVEWNNNATDFEKWCNTPYYFQSIILQKKYLDYKLNRLQSKLMTVTQ